MRMVQFKCEECGTDFETLQGSRRRFCDKCLLARVSGGKKIEPRDETPHLPDHSTNLTVPTDRR